MPELVSDLATAGVPFYFDPKAVTVHLEGFSAELVRARLLRRDLTRVTSIRLESGPLVVGTFYGQQDGSGTVLDDDASARLWLESHYAERSAGGNESPVSWEATKLTVDGTVIAGWRTTTDGRNLVYGWRQDAPTVFVIGPPLQSLPALNSTRDYGRLGAMV